MIALGALFLAGFYKYTVAVHQAWAEAEGEALGLDAESRGVGTILRGAHRGVPLWMALSGRRVTEGEAQLVVGGEPPNPDAYREARALFGSVHFKGASIWADFPRSKPGEDPARYADALSVAARFAALRTPESLYRFEEGEEE
jgi:hypothetical protein